MSDFAYPLHEECGVFGIYDRAGTEDVAAAAYSAQTALPHHGQATSPQALNANKLIPGRRAAALRSTMTVSSRATATSAW